MRLTIHGGVGEKGRTSIAVEHDGARLLLDAGVNTSVPRGADYYPAITPKELAATQAIVLTHAHEDHAAALGWCAANGFAGRVIMTAQTEAELGATLAAYATPEEAALAGRIPVERMAPGQAFAFGPFAAQTGRSGHVVGGVWIRLAQNGKSVLHCGDVVPASPVFAMDAPPPCDVLLLDASYGDDRVPPAERGRAVRDWLAAHPAGAVLPTPLSGRSIELLALIDGPIAIAAAMRAPMERQIAAGAWLAPDVAARLSERLARAANWREGAPLPRAALICDDGMGLAGPSRSALAQAAEARHPVLLTGHVPDGTPAAALLGSGRAAWLRLPTHPTAPENAALATASGARCALAHSCDAATAQRLAAIIPNLRGDVRVGDVIEL